MLFTSHHFLIYIIECSNNMSIVLQSDEQNFTFFMTFTLKTAFKVQVSWNVTLG